MELTSFDIKEICLREGALMAGIASVGRFDGISPGCRPADKFEKCRSVIVLGSAFPENLFSMDADEYTKCRMDMVAKLDGIARQVEGFMQECGYGAKAVNVLNEKKDDPDFWDHMSMKRAAEYAGLGRVIRNKLLTNPVYGNMLWFAAVLTDGEFTPDEIMTEDFCGGCNLCIIACPAGALNDPEQLNQAECDKFRIRVEDSGKITVLCYECRRACPLRFGVPVRSEPESLPGLYDKLPEAEIIKTPV